MEKRRITSLDTRYRQGDLSVFPTKLDSYFTLFEAGNNLETILSHKITEAAKYLIVEDASRFPASGILRIYNAKGTNVPEIIYYGKKIGNQFHILQRGYGKHLIGAWDAGSIVSCPVMSEQHNALKDAIMKIEQKIGLINNPHIQSLHGTIRNLEQRWLAPKAIFRAFPTNGVPPLTVRFQNFSGGHGLHYLWDFGDGTTSTEKHPNHTYLDEGNYTVKLNMVSVTKAQGFAEKSNYITVSKDKRVPFFYGRPLIGKSNITEFTFVDQTDGNIVERHWFFGDGTDKTVTNPNHHVIKHVYTKPGEYSPTLMICYADEQISHATTEGISVYDTR
jgi:PKD repeat protein